MNEMVERVAREIEAEFAEMEPNDVHRWRRLARAAIAAMREPTFEMCVAGGPASPAIWCDMIDEALRDG